MNRKEGAGFFTISVTSYQTVVQCHCQKTTLKTFTCGKQKISAAFKLDYKLGLLKVRIGV